MAKTHSKNAVFKVDDSGGTLRDISPAVSSVRGLPGSASLAEVTAFSDAGATFVRGPEDVTFTVEGPWDDAATTGTATVLGGIRDTGATASFEYGPAGEATGAVRYTGEAWCTRFDVDTTVPRAARYTATFQVNGAVTVGAFP